jgi:hypothetical protein
LTTLTLLTSSCAVTGCHSVSETKRVPTQTWSVMEPSTKVRLAGSAISGRQLSRSRLFLPEMTKYSPGLTVATLPVGLT